MFSAELQHLLITIDKSGCVLVTKTDDRSTTTKYITPPSITQQEVVSVSGAGDCFNSGFLSAMLHNFGIEKSVEIAKDCANKSLRSIDAVPEDLLLRV
uniref:Carbohydrate kinase PfkB domain-containing protein n=1 Tax=Ditylenchus dipsaci TaxID=166011 RepID=A0A915EGA4_9BILA